MIDPYQYWWTTVGKDSPTTTGRCTSNIKDPDYAHDLNCNAYFESVEVVADVEYKEVKDDSV